MCNFWIDRSVGFSYYNEGNLRRDGYLQLFIFEGNGMVDPGLYELVEKILWAVSFITIGGDTGSDVFFGICPEYLRFKDDTFSA